MSHTLNRSFALERFKCGNAIKLSNRIMCNFYLGLPRMQLLIYHSTSFGWGFDNQLHLHMQFWFLKRYEHDGLAGRYLYWRQQIKCHLRPTSQMIYHRGGEPERAMHCWFNVMAQKPWITAEFVTVCCSMSMVSNTLCSHFFGQWSYCGYTHTLTKLHTEVTRWISRAYECRLCMDSPEVNSTTVCDLYCLWAACNCLSWSAVAMRALTWVIFIPQASC